MSIERNWLLGAAEELIEREMMETQMESVLWQLFPVKINNLLSNFHGKHHRPRRSQQLVLSPPPPPCPTLGTAVHRAAGHSASPSLTDTPVPAARDSCTGEGLLSGGLATVHGTQSGSLPVPQQAKFSWKSCASPEQGTAGLTGSVEPPRSAAAEHQVPHLRGAERAT